MNRRGTVSDTTKAEISLASTIASTILISFKFIPLRFLCFHFNCAGDAAMVRIGNKLCAFRGSLVHCHCTVYSVTQSSFYISINEISSHQTSYGFETCFLYSLVNRPLQRSNSPTYLNLF